MHKGWWPKYVWQRLKPSFSNAGLDVWYPQEERNEAFALAMRLLFSTLDLDQQEDAYPFFLDSHGSRLQNLNSWDVLQFIMRQSGILAGEKCMVAFCIDEVRPPVTYLHKFPRGQNVCHKAEKHGPNKI